MAAPVAGAIARNPVTFAERMVEDEAMDDYFGVQV
jgi:hypothetical protein